MDRRDFIQSSIVGAGLLASGVWAADNKDSKKAGSTFQLHGTDVYGKTLDLKDFAGRTVLVVSLPSIAMCVRMTCN